MDSLRDSNDIQIWAHFAPEGFEAELEEELRSSSRQEILARYGRLFLAQGPAFDPAWAQTTWIEPEEVPIQSINDAARQLRSRALRWIPYAFQLYRRTELIREKLPKVREEKLHFLAPLPDRRMGHWTLIDANRLLVSTRTTTPLPHGEIHFHEDKTAPSRAYLKLWELFTAHGVRPPQPGESCLDLGASPGGWTWVLAHLGCSVKAVDRSPLAPAVGRLKNVSFTKGNAFTLAPSSVGRIDWLFSDVICTPEKSYQLIDKWLSSGLVRNIVCTIKFKGKTDHEIIQRLRAIPGAKIKHMFHNKHELTWWRIDSSSLPS